MSKTPNLDVLAYGDSPIGTICLRRRELLASPGTIVTEITTASTYYSAEEYHQDYYRQNKEQGYCQMVIAPKLGKLGLEK